MIKQPGALYAELLLSLMKRAESYRVRLLRLSSPEREQELHKISKELAQENEAVQNSVCVVLEGFRPAESSFAHEELTFLQKARQERPSQDYEKTRCMRLAAQVVTHWGLRIVQHYGWDG